ncbi:MAG: hypothetical protein HY824_02105 [Acidobacteria bacterium]|nr:hypothetical protein [Acidobacteriota bacterium]
MTLRQVVLVLPLFVLPGARADAAGADRSRVTIRVYDAARLDDALKTTALAVAGDVFAPASVGVAWKKCAPAGTAPPCDRPPAGDLVVRILRSTLRHAEPALPLGDALVDEGTHSAVLATIYADWAERLAQTAGADLGRLLGYAIAHEVAHLLLASNAHSAAGLMRSIWRGEELRDARAGDWTLTAADIAAIRARLHAPGDPNIIWATR